MRWPQLTMRRWLIAAAAIGLVVSGITFVWLRIGWAFSGDPGPFLGGVSVGMSREEVEARAGQPYRRLPDGGELTPLGVGPARTVAGETWVYVTGPFRVHRFAVEFQGDKVARIIHDKS